MKHFHLDSKGFAVISSAVIVALAIFISFGVAVIVQRNSLFHQAGLTQQRISRSAHEQLNLTVIRNPDDTVITVTNVGSAPAAFDYLLLRQPNNRVVAGPANWPKSLVGWWKFSEGSGNTAYDYSGNGNDGTLHGDPEWVGGRIGDGALSFDGDDDYVDVPDSPSLSPTSQISFGLWLNLRDYDSVYPGNPSHHIFKGGAFGLSSTVGWITDGGTRQYADFSTIPLNEWHHVFITYDGSQIKSYFDGNEDSVVDYIGDIDDSSAVLRIGNAGGANWGTDGKIDDVRIYDRALSPDEISQLSSYNVLIDPIGLNPLESYSVTYPYRIDDGVTVGAVTRLGNEFWEEES